ncbi:hypothetical protein [Actinomadura harenae]|uniref:hypothetical protein n=1 Tax=Actinomadura harenae TaxID=2483351 RepID=UPI0011C3A9E9|nr:hypothetical protein [Actinomadura harenae]
MSEERSLWDGDVEYAPGIIGDAPPRMNIPESPAEQEIDEQNAVALMQGDFTAFLEPQADAPEHATTPDSGDTL